MSLLVAFFLLSRVPSNAYDTYNFTYLQSLNWFSYQEMCGSYSITIFIRDIQVKERSDKALRLPTISSFPFAIPFEPLITLFNAVVEERLQLQYRENEESSNRICISNTQPTTINNITLYIRGWWCEGVWNYKSFNASAFSKWQPIVCNCRFPIIKVYINLLLCHFRLSRWLRRKWWKYHSIGEAAFAK